MRSEQDRYFNRYIAKLLTNLQLNKMQETYLKQQMRHLQKDIYNTQENIGTNDNKGTNDEKTTAYIQ